MRRRNVSIVVGAIATAVAGLAINLLSARLEIGSGWIPVTAMLVCAVIAGTVASSGPAAGDPTAERFPRLRAAAAPAAVALAVGLLVYFVHAVGTQRRDPDSSVLADPTKPSASATTSATWATSTPSAPGGVCPLNRTPEVSGPTTLTGLPSGWRAYADTKQFCVAVPAAWVHRPGTEDNVHTFFDDRTGTRTLEISQSTQPADDPLADFQNKVKKGQYPHELQGCTAYKPIQLDRTPGEYLVTVRSGDVVAAVSADWEFACTLGGTRRHAFYRNFITKPHVQAYAIVWYTNDSDAAADRPAFEQVLKTFIGAR